MTAKIINVMTRSYGKQLGRTVLSLRCRSDGVQEHASSRFVQLPLNVGVSMKTFRHFEGTQDDHLAIRGSCLAGLWDTKLGN